MYKPKPNHLTAYSFTTCSVCGSTILINESGQPYCPVCDPTENLKTKIISMVWANSCQRSPHINHYRRGLV